MRPPRWSAISESGFEWEREALDFLREHLPDHEPYRAWSNLEFIDDEGRVNEVDALVLTPTGLILVEVKSRPGTLQGDPHTWTWTTDGRQISDDNPLLLANRKAKRLASLLRRQDAFGRGKVRIPWVEAAIFLSGVRAEPRLDPGSEQKVFRRGDPRSASDRGIIAALTGTSGAELGRRGSVDSNVARATQRAVEQAGIRPRLRSRRVGDYELGAPLAEGGGWQDFLAKHVSLGVARRVRVYPFARAASPEERKRLGRMAAREFRVLEGIDHPGILRVLHFEESELGPALVFEHDPAAMRLDQFLAQHLKDLTLEARLDLLRQLAVGLGYAHGKRLYHQGLTPQNVLVRDLTSDRPRVQIMNWQVAARGEGSTNAVLMMTVGSRDLDDHFADPAKVYLAPESLRARTESGPRADVFSLGAIAYHLFTGKPPADNPLDLPEKLRAGDGLRLSEAIDGVGAGLEDLIRMSTAPNVAQRIGSAPEFLEYMALAEADNRPEPPAPATVDPSVAQRDDRLDGGLLVERRLGRGSTADALLVRREKDGQRLVLKVAIDEVHGDHLRAEAELLSSLHHHQNIVQFVDTITVSGRVGMLMEWAGEETLASLIRSPTPLSLDLVRRYGDELLQAVDYLEQQGVAHRDIKPDNIGVGAVGGTGRKRLVLFDFSLGRTPPENIQAGTQPYLDPFLPLRRPPRWDLQAERYAAAVTLNEMLTGAPPVWGDGLSDPAATEDEARIGSERFEPSLRDGLVAFFRRALSRAPEERFGNAEDMLRAWRQAFAPLDQRPIGQDDLEVIARQLDRRSPIAELGFGVEARDVLLRMHIHTVQQLLAVDRIRFRYLRNVGDKIRREIRLRAKHLAEYRPDLQADGDDTLVPGRASLDRLGELLLPRRPAGDEISEDRALANYLGIEGASAWPTPGDVAKACEIPRSVVATALEQARDRWHRARELNELRADVAALLQGAGGVATVDELAGQLLAARGSVEEDESDRDRLARAASSLHHHQNIVQFVDTITVSGRVGMLMEWAGEETLASLIRSPTPLSLDLVRRYGDELLQAVDYLEQQGVAHRDIKPDNIGVGAVGGTGRKRLVLFDFSLGRTPPENIQAGTQPYLDPFLPLRRPPRWDLQAERYAAAVTLNEMLTGAPPVWGDGLSDPAATEDEARIGSERFEPSLRDGLVAFFRRALSRAPEERFGNAEDMLRAWRQAFAPLDQRPIGQDDLEVIARQLDRRSPIAELGFGVEARDVLLRMHIHTVQQLLAVDRIRFRYLRNVGDKIRREIRLRAKHLAEYRPDLQADGDDTLVPGRASLDRLGELLLPRRPAGDEISEDRALANYLGIEGASAWPTPGDVAKACEIPRSVVATALEQARDRWHRARELNELRADVAALLQGAGGVATVDELAGQLLAARGSVEEDESDRDRLARAALRAAVELEASVEPIRFAANAEAEPVLLATHPDLADHARRLGQAADQLAASDPLPSPNRAQQELADVLASTTVAPPPAQRLLRLAAAASRNAALSARLELYPRGMAPLAALRLSLGSLVGAQRLTEVEVRERVRGRYPDAAPLPDRPDLDALLEEAGAERVWRPDENGGAYYAKDDTTDSSTSSLMRHGTLAPAVEATPDVLSARDLEEKLVYAAKTGAFLALTVEPRRAVRAEAELLRRFPRQRVSLERLLLQALREEAATRKAKWSVVLAADAARPDTTDFKRLLSLAARAAVGVRRQALTLPQPTLLVNPGLLARYNLMPILTDLSQASGTRGGPPGLWLLVPQPDEGMPHIDGSALPVINSANWARLTDPWLANVHRAGAHPAG